MSFLLVELSLEELSPLWVVSGRTVSGALTLYVVLRVTRNRLPRDRRSWGHLLVLGTVNNAVPWTAISWSQQTIPSGLAAVLVAMVPTSTLLVATLVGLDRITGRRLAGLFVAVGGVAAIVLEDLGQPGRVVAVLTVVAATVALATGAVYAKLHVSGRLPPLALATGQIMCAAAVSTPLALLVDGDPSLGALRAGTWAAVLLLGTTGTSVAFLVFYVLVERVGPTNATMVTYLIPLVAVGAGVLLLGERLGPLTLFGGGLVVAGIGVAQLGLRRAGR
jgi:drug/metabolite transporter (DMT)-like permease